MKTIEKEQIKSIMNENDKIIEFSNLDGMKKEDAIIALLTQQINLLQSVNSILTFFEVLTIISIICGVLMILY